MKRITCIKCGKKRNESYFLDLNSLRTKSKSCKKCNGIDEKPEKKCISCGEIKPSKDFYKRSKKKEVLHSSCKKCMKMNNKGINKKVKTKDFDVEKEREKILKRKAKAEKKSDIIPNIFG